MMREVVYATRSSIKMSHSYGFEIIFDSLRRDAIIRDDLEVRTPSYAHKSSSFQMLRVSIPSLSICETVKTRYFNLILIIRQDFGTSLFTSTFISLGAI